MARLVAGHLRSLPVAFLMESPQNGENINHKGVLSLDHLTMGWLFLVHRMLIGSQE